MELCFVNFRDFRDSAEYEVARVGLSELSYFYELNWKNCSGASSNEEHDVKTSASDVNAQQNI